MLGFLGGLGLGSKVAIGMGVMLLVVLAGSAWYFKYSQNQLAELNQTVAAEKARAASAESNLDKMRNDVRRQTEALQELAREQAQIRREQEELTDLFADHDLKAIAERKPNLLETRVNAGTKKVLEELERLTDPDSYNRRLGEEFIKKEEN